jgi:hypothetical protein
VIKASADIKVREVILFFVAQEGGLLGSSCVITFKD